MEMNKWTRYLVLALGWISLVVGIIGIFLPLLPTTPFLLLTGFCFYRSSPIMHAWLYRQRYIGRVLADWEERGAISRLSKISAISMMLLSLGIMWWKVQFFWLKIMVTILLISVGTFVVTRPSK